MKKKNKKYGFGGIIDDPLSDYFNMKRSRASNIPNQIETPDTALYQNDININKALQNVQNNPFIQGLDLFGNLALQLGSSMMNKSFKNVNNIYGTGGKVPINVEGNEIVETPNGKISEIKGQSHNEGGVDIEVPKGTEIFSKRIKGPDGKTMAERKKYRELKLSKLQKLYDSNSTDKILKNTLDRTRENFQIQEEQDLQTMEIARQLSLTKKFATGGVVSPLPIYDWMDSYNYYLNQNNQNTTNSEQPQTNNTKIFDNKNFQVSLGDIIGTTGQLISTSKPMQNTIANRAGDIPNTNAFKNYGKEGLNKLEESKQYINQIRDSNLQDLELTRASQISRNRNSARGLNTMRSLDLSIDLGVNNTKSNIYNQFMQAMTNIYGQQSQLENQQDEMVMQGEQNRDLADRQDRDNYFTQMAQDIATKGSGLQHIGKNVNEIKTRNVTGSLMNQIYDNFSINSMTGEAKIKATQELNTAPSFYQDANKIVLQKIINNELVRKGDRLYDLEGNELNKKTLEKIGSNTSDKVTQNRNANSYQEILSLFNIINKI
jgi:hypothetical protein